MAAPQSIVTRDARKLSEPTGNIYKSLAIMSTRANQIANEEKEELTQKLAEFATTADNLEEVFENKEQIEISRHYERMPKPSARAVDEFERGKLYFSTPDEGEEEIKKS